MDFKELSLSSLHIHAHHIPDPTLDNLEGEYLLQFVKTLGFLQALLVTERGPDEYLILDGARRYLCAKKLGLSTVPCIIRPDCDEVDYHIIRFVLHNMEEPWTKQEHAEYLKRIKGVVEKKTGD